MSFEEEFDHIIKQKADEANFPFDEKNWEKVSRQLDAERKGGGILAGRKLYIVAGVFIIFSLAGVLMLKEMGAEHEDTSTLNSSNLQNPEAKVEKQTAMTAPLVPGEVKSPVSGNTQKINTEERPLNPSGDMTEAKQQNLTAFASSVSVRKRVSATEILPGKENLTSEVNPQEQLGSSEPAFQSQAPVAKQIAITPSQADAPTANAMMAKTTVIDAGEIQETQGLVTLIPITIGLPAVSGERDIVPIQFSRLSYLDEDYFRNDKNKLHFLNLEAGTSYLSGWQTKNGTDGRGFNWFAGLNYGIYLSRKLTVGAGFQVYNITNITQPFYSGSTTEFGFSAVTSHTTITSNSLFYASVPLKVTYVLNTHNQFGLGFNMGFLMNAKNNLQTYTSSPENGNSAISNNKKMGAYPGIAPTVMLLSAFYKTKLTRRLALNGELIVGLTDLFNNTTSNKNLENVMGLRLSLQYTLFDK